MGTVLSGIVHALQSGGRWGDCPPVYGPKKTLYNRFVRWAERGIWENIFSALAGAEDVPDRLFIDSTCICQWAPKFPWKRAFKIPYVAGGVGLGDQPKDGSCRAFSGGRPLRFGGGGGLMVAVVRM